MKYRLTEKGLLMEAANVKERPFAKSGGWPLSYVRGAVLVAALVA
jgi:hypothetical protein